MLFQLSTGQLELKKLEMHEKVVALKPDTSAVTIAVETCRKDTLS